MLTNDIDCNNEYLLYRHTLNKTLCYTQLFIVWTIFQPWALSSNIPTAERG